MTRNIYTVMIALLYIAMISLATSNAFRRNSLQNMAFGELGKFVKFLLILEERSLTKMEFV